MICFPSRVAEGTVPTELTVPLRAVISDAYKFNSLKASGEAEQYVHVLPFEVGRWGSKVVQQLALDQEEWPQLGCGGTTEA